MKTIDTIAEACGLDPARTKILKRVLDDTLGGGAMEQELQEIIGALYRRIDRMDIEAVTARQTIGLMGALIDKVEGEPETLSAKAKRLGFKEHGDSPSTAEVRKEG